MLDLGAGDADRDVDAGATGRPGSSPGQALPGEQGRRAPAEKSTASNNAERAATQGLLKLPGVPGADVAHIEEVNWTIGARREERKRRELRHPSLLPYPPARSRITSYSIEFTCPRPNEGHGWVSPVAEGRMTRPPSV